MIVVEDYAIYSHILCSYQGRELSIEEKKRTKIVTLLFVLNDATCLLNLFKKIENLDNLSCKGNERLFTIGKYCDQLFSIPTDAIFSTNSGLFNKIFFCIDLLNKFEQIQDTQDIRNRLYSKVKEKTEQLKLDLYVMEKGLSPYDKIEPDFESKPFIKYMSTCAKKLMETSYIFIKNHMDDETVLLSLIQKKRDLISLFGRKKVNSLLSEEYPAGPHSMNKHLLLQYQKRGFFEFIKNNLTLLKNK